MKSYIYTDRGRLVRPGILEKYSIKSSNNGSQQIPEDPFTSTYGARGIVEPLYNPTQLVTLTEVNVYHNRCCKQKALDVAGSGFSIQPTTKGKGSEANKKKLEDFFKNRVPHGTWQKAAQDFEEVGYAGIELVRYNNNPKAEPKTAVYIPAHTFRIHKDKTKFLQERGTGKVWFKNIEYEGEIDSNTGDSFNTDAPQSPEALGRRANELLYLTNHTARSDYYGFPDSIPAIPTMYGEQGRATYNVAFFENYGIPTYAITITGDFDEGERDETSGLTLLEEQLQEQLQSIQENPHSTMVISIPSRDGLEKSNVGVEFQPLSTETKDASFRLYRMDNRDEVITAHGMDPYRIGVMQAGSLGGNTAIESKKNYKNGVIQPRQQLWEDAINRYIVEGAFGITDYRFVFNPIDLEDEESDLAIMKDLFQMAAVTPSQLIKTFGERFGLEPVEHPALDAHYLNGVPIDYTPETPVPVDVVETLKNLRDGILKEVARENRDSPEDSTISGRLIKKLKGTLTT